jgi:membrane protein DedA with SNARE-associated domain
MQMLTHLFATSSLTGLQDLLHVYGLWAVFALIMLESMGVPLPGEASLVAAALYAGSIHRIEITSVIMVATLAAIVGDNVGYLIGRTIGLPLIIKYGKYVRLDEARLRVGQYLFLKHGGKIVFFGRFVAFLRVFAALLAGVNRMPWSHFLLMNALGGLGWASLFGGGAYFFGERIKSIEGPIGIILLFIAVCLAIAAILFFKKNEREMEIRANAALSSRVQEGAEI